MATILEVAKNAWDVVIPRCRTQKPPTRQQKLLQKVWTWKTFASRTSTPATAMASLCATRLINTVANVVNFRIVDAVATETILRR